MAPEFVYKMDTDPEIETNVKLNMFNGNYSRRLLTSGGEDAHDATLNNIVSAIGAYHAEEIKRIGLFDSGPDTEGSYFSGIYRVAPTGRILTGDDAIFFQLTVNDMGSSFYTGNPADFNNSGNRAKFDQIMRNIKVGNISKTGDIIGGVEGTILKLIRSDSECPSTYGYRQL
jgi:hypothetical protein